MIEKTIEVERMEHVISVFGSFDQNMRIIESELGVKVLDVYKRQSFRSGRFEFETALHEICEWGTKENPGGCRRICDEFGLDIPWHMVPDNFRVITTASDGRMHIDATLPCTVKEFVNEMERLVPGCRKSIQDLFDLGTEFHAAGDYSLSVAGKTDPKYMQEHRCV